MYICLDLSLSSTGYSIFTEEGELVRCSKYSPSLGSSVLYRICDITFNISSLLPIMSDLIIEDVFLGITGVKNLVNLSRLAGSFVWAWHMCGKRKEPIFYSAVHARKLVGIKGNSHKSEIQLFVLQHYNLISKKKIFQYSEEIKGVRELKSKGELTVSKTRYRLDKISKKIELDSGYGEDVCDSIILGMAHNQVKRERDND